MLKEALERIAELEAQNRALIAENNRLREILGIDVSVPSEEQKDTTEKIVSAPELPFANAAINKYSPPDEKIDLYMSLFRGREDVYAKRCYSKSHDSSYYIPACRHEWVKGICGRPQVKCKNCDKRELLPLTKEVINSHLRNKDEHGVGIIGIYPLLGDDTCLFLAVDFDEAEWQKDVTAFRDVCGKLNVPVAVERSRSGNGAHAWFFFEEAVAAVSARRLGNALLTEAMSQRHEIKFASYDRMFPNQDFMPKGGFGNLIALPLQGGARIHGNSEFVDEAFQSYPDQWAYLSSIRKMTLTDIEAFLATFGNGSNLGELANANNNGEDEITKPWEKKSSIIPLADRDFPNTLTIVEANRLYIPKQGITQRALNRIKRLAAFQNPLFYKTQKMRMSTYGIPRIIYSLEETDEYIGIPRGCQISLCQLLNEAQASYLFEDKRNTGRDIQVEFMGTLQAEQQESVDALLLHENGVLSLPTAFGKTVIGASLIAARKCNTLILVHLHTLLEQWKKSLEQFLEINETLAEEPIKRGRKKKRCIIGQIGSGKNTASGIIDIALVQSLIHNNEVDEIVKNYGMVLVDECHHVPSVNYEKVLSEVNAKYIYGLTATPIRQDGQHPIVFMQCGPIRFKVTAKEQSAKHSFEHFIVPRFTGFRKPYSLSDENWHITQIYATLAEDDARNERIVNDVKNVLDDGRTPIILTQRTEQVNCLANKLKGLTDAHIITLIGAS
ncbi:MAG: DEAD/DEAH box helicase family protein, partial [Prevotellaceae bacterium]|nr:DEAD/DEAH box helicase family protein [Prevotellaceae bacterium]